MNSIKIWGTDLIAYLQQFESLAPIMDFFSIFVRPEYMMVFVIPIVFWITREKWLVHLYALINIEFVLGETLRIIFAQPRPWWIADLIPYDPVTSIYSGPAGYTSMAIVMWGALAYAYKKKWLVVLGVVMILLSNVAKMYEAAMLPDDMFWGALVGAALLYVFIRYHQDVLNWLQKASKIQMGFLLASVFGLTVLLFVIAAAIHNQHSFPAQWIQYALIPEVRFALGGHTLGGGFIIGILLGLYQSREMDFKQSSSLISRVMSPIIGVLGITGIFFVIRPQIAGLFTSAYATGFVTMSTTFLMGWWASYYVPLLTDTLVQNRPLEKRKQMV